MKVKFANKIYEVLCSKEVAGKTIYAVEDEPNHIDWLVNVEVIDTEEEPEDERIKKRLIDLIHEVYIHSSLTREEHKEILSWIRRQKDKKDIHLLELKAKAYDDAKERMSYAYNQNRVPIRFINEIFPNIKLYEKQGEPKDYGSIDPHFCKPINKAESIFEVGNCVVVNGKEYTFLVKKGAPRYQVEDTNCDIYSFYLLPNGEEEYHLWTIKDAKDGDILAGKIDGDSYILIYKQIKDGWIETYGHYYDSVDRFCVPSQLFCREVNGTFYPATKEQRNLLFQKMKEAGYEWDENAKKLIKL